jgi:hypothetical protein
LLDLNSRATVVQDAARGIPEAMLTEYESAQRAIERALRDSGKDIRSAIERAESVSRKAAEAYEAQRNALSFRKPTSEEVISRLIGYQRPQVCGVRDFVLPFIRGHADPAFDTESPITTVRQGIIGWGDHSDSPPQIVNTGSGNGQMINGNLDLYWRACLRSPSFPSERATEAVRKDSDGAGCVNSSLHHSPGERFVRRRLSVRRRRRASVS